MLQNSIEKKERMSNECLRGDLKCTTCTAASQLLSMNLQTLLPQKSSHITCVCNVHMYLDLSEVIVLLLLGDGTLS